MFKKENKYSHLLHDIIEEYSIIQVFVLQCFGIRWLEGFNLSSQRQRQQKHEHTMELYQLQSISDMYVFVVNVQYRLVIGVIKHDGQRTSPREIRLM